MSYAAFISYSHADAPAASALQRALHRFAKPWYKLRALRVYRDTTDLFGTVLGSAIEKGLLDARYFILIASPQSAKSDWVRKELEFWLENKTIKRILIVVTAGALVWDDRSTDFDWRRTDALPSFLAGKFSEEPLFVDLRDFEPRSFDLSNSDFRRHLCSVAAPLHGKSPEELDGEDTRQHRRTLRIATGTALAVVALMTAALFAWRDAISQRDLKESASRLELARSLVDAADFTLQQQPQLQARAALLAIEAARLEPSLLEANTALRSALALLPRNVARLEHGAQVTDLAFDASGSRLVSVSEDTMLRVWDLASEKELLSRSHGEEVNAVALTPNGHYAATASGTRKLLAGPDERDRTVRLWDLRSGRLAFQSPQQSGPVVDVAFAPAGDILASGDVDGNATVWSVPDGRILAELPHRTGSVGVVSFGPGSELLLTRSGNAGFLWNWRRRRELIRFDHNANNHSYAMTAVALSGSGALTASAALDDSGRVWDSATGALVSRLEHREPVNDIGFHQGSDIVVTGSQDGTVRLWSARTGEETLRWNHGAPVSVAAFSASGARVLSAGYRGTVRVWNVGRGTERARVVVEGRLEHARWGPTDTLFATAHGATIDVWEIDDAGVAAQTEQSEPITSIALTSYMMAVASLDGTVAIVNLTERGAPERLSFDDTVTSLALSPDGRYLVAASRSGLVSQFDALDLTPLHEWVHTAPVMRLAISADSRLLFTATATDGERTSGLKAWDLSTGDEVWSSDDVHRVASMAVDPGGALIATGGMDRVVRVWDASTGRELATAEHDDAVVAVAFSPDGRLLASGAISTTRLDGRDSSDNSVRVWDTDGFAEVRRVQHEAPVVDVVFSPDGQWLASASTDGIARITGVDLATAPLVLRHDGPIGNVRFSPDSQFLATGGGGLRQSSNPEISVRRVADGVELARLTLDSPVQAFAFSPEGTRIAAGTLQGAGMLVDWRSEDLIEEACRRLDRNLTYDEWQQYRSEEPYAKTCADLGVHPSVIETAQQLARSGDTADAVEIYARVAALEPERNLSPQDEANRQLAEGLLGRAAQRAVRGDVTEAEELMTRAIETSAALEGTPRTWNDLCWWGALGGRPREALLACERAVELAPSDGHLRDSRALARALTGDFAGAAEDLQVAIESSVRDEEWQRRSGAITLGGIPPEEFRRQRQAWREALEDGRNPYDAAVLELLRDQ